MKTSTLVAITVIVLLFTFIPFEMFFIHDTASSNQNNRYHILVKDEKISDIPAPYIQNYRGQTDRLLPMLVTQHIQSDFPISSVNLRDIQFLNNIEYQSNEGGIANFPIPGNYDTGVKTMHGQPVIPLFGSGFCPSIGYDLKVSCGPDDQRSVTYGRCNIPIMRTFSDILSTQTRGVFPEQDGTYKLEFMSYYEADIELPDNADMMSHKILACDVIGNNEYFAKVYYYETQFTLKE